MALPRRAWLAIAAAAGTAAVLVIVLVLALGGGDEERSPRDGGRRLPSGAKLLAGAAEAMRDVSSGRFVLDAKGELGGIQVRHAEGVMTRDGQAQGTAQLDEGGTLVELEVVYLRGTVYIKGPTGGFQTVPRSVAGTLYDPTNLLDPKGGLAELLLTAKAPRTVDQERVGGEDAFRIRTTLDGDILGPLVPNPVPKDTPATVWVGVDDPFLLQVTTEIPASGSHEAANVTLAISDFNVPVHVTAPPGA